MVCLARIETLKQCLPKNVFIQVNKGKMPHKTLGQDQGLKGYGLGLGIVRVIFRNNIMPDVNYQNVLARQNFQTCSWDMISVGVAEKKCGALRMNTVNNRALKSL